MDKWVRSDLLKKRQCKHSWLLLLATTVARCCWDTAADVYLDAGGGWQGEAIKVVMGQKKEIRRGNERRGVDRGKAFGIFCSAFLSFEEEGRGKSPVKSLS